jgi:hypothetical protein
MRRAFEADQGTEGAWVAQGEMQHDAAADRASHDDRPIETQRFDDGHDQAGVVIGGQAVFLILPAGGRRGFAVPRHVEGDDAKAAGDAGAVHQPAILPPIRAGGVQADERDSLARLFEIEAVMPAGVIEMQIAPGDWLDRGAHRGASRRQANSAFQ